MSEKASSELVFHGGAKKRLFRRPASPEARLNRAFRNAAYFSLILQAGSDSKHREVSVSSSVSCLFRASCPIAIVLRVRTVVVLALKTKPDGSISHIQEKVLKGLPSFANPNSPASIILEIWTVCVFTSLPHAFPDSVFLGVGAPVGCDGKWKRIPSIASARFRISAQKKPVSYGVNLSAVAPANARASVVFGLSISNNNQPCKASSVGDMNFSRHNDGDSLLCSAVGDRRQPALAAKLTNLPQQARAIWN